MEATAVVSVTAVPAVDGGCSPKHADEQKDPSSVVMHQLPDIKTEPLDPMPPLASPVIVEQHHQPPQQPQDAIVAAAVMHQTSPSDIKNEPLDPMPPLASPVTVVDGIAAVNGVSVVSLADKIREQDSSPPTTVISLAPAQPYSTAATQLTPAQLTFATPAYDIAAHNGQYTVQVSLHARCSTFAGTPCMHAAMRPDNKCSRPDCVFRHASRVHSLATLLPLSYHSLRYFLPPPAFHLTFKSRHANNNDPVVCVTNASLRLPFCLSPWPA